MSATLRFLSSTVFLLLAAALCSSQSADDKRASFTTHVQKAKEQLDAKRPDLAIPELQAAADIDPGNVEVQGNLASCCTFKANRRRPFRT